MPHAHFSHCLHPGSSFVHCTSSIAHLVLNLILFDKERICTNILQLFKVLFSLGLDEITSEKDSLASSRQRNAAAKATEEPRRKRTDQDEDYKPKLTPGCHPFIDLGVSAFCLSTFNVDFLLGSVK